MAAKVPEKDINERAKLVAIQATFSAISIEKKSKMQCVLNRGLKNKVQNKKEQNQQEMKKDSVFSDHYVVIKDML